MSRTLTRWTIPALVLALGGCAEEGAGDDGPEGIAILGGYSHSIDNVTVDVVATGADGLNMPRDLAFNPDRPDELWLVNYADPSVLILHDAGTPQQSADLRSGVQSVHFLAKPAALAFGAPGTMATAQEEDGLTQGEATPPDFMGPTLWSTDLSIFDAAHVGHLDMLHNSPNAAGIAWQNDNAYWVFDGYHSSLTRYDFNTDHGPGGTNHRDGNVARYVEGDVKHEPGVPSHLVYRADTQLLYVADTGNSRVAVLDTTTGNIGTTIFPNYDGGPQYRVTDAQLSELVSGADVGLMKPSGLEIFDDILFVTDNETSTIFAFSMDGELLDWLDTEIAPGALMGITVDASGRLYLVDATDDRVIRISPAPVSEE